MASKNKTEEAARKPPDLPDLAHLTLISAADILKGQPLEESLADSLDLAGKKIPALHAKASLFRNLSLANCEIGPTRLRDIRFEKCDLSNSVLRGFEATRVEFLDCRLMGMRAIECRWDSVLLENCDARYAQLNSGQVRLCEFRGANLEESDFRGTDLERAIFTQTSLIRADLTRVRLPNADLRGAQIEGVTIGPDDVRGAIVTAAQAMDLARLLGLIIK